MSLIPNLRINPGTSWSFQTVTNLATSSMLSMISKLLNLNSVNGLQDEPHPREKFFVEDW